MIYLGALLLGLIYLAITVAQNGSLGPMFDRVQAWIHAYQPFSYILILTLCFAAIFSIKLIYSWPKAKEPENPLAKYHRGDDVLEE